MFNTMKPSDNGQPARYGQNQGYGHPAGPQINTSNIQIVYATPGTVVVRETNRPPNVLLHAIFVTVCCFCPTGIAAVFFANEANTKMDNQNAWRNYRLAIVLIVLSLLFGLVGIGVVTAMKMKREI